MCYFIDVAPLKPAKKIAEFKRDKGFDYLKKIKYETGFLLKNKQFMNLVYYTQIKNIKSFKLKAFLPINGQRNKTNARVAKAQAKIFQTLINIGKKKTSSKNKTLKTKKR
jgi:ribosomal protein S13